MYLSTCGNEQGSRRAQAPARRIAALTGTPRTAGGDASIENGNNGFVLSEELTVLRDQVRRIIRDEIIPIESRLDPTRPKFQRTNSGHSRARPRPTEELRPLQETPDPDDDPTREWRKIRASKKGT
jgi:hypothetical protein